MKNFDTIMKGYVEEEYENNLMSFMEDFSNEIKVPDLTEIHKKLSLKFGIYDIKIIKNEIVDKGLLHNFTIIANDKNSLMLELGTLYYLGKIKHFKSMKILVSRLRLNFDDAIICQALYSLGCLGYEESLEDIISILEESSSNQVKNQAIWAIGRINNSEAIDKTCKYLSSNELRSITISTLGKSNNIKYAAQIKPFLASKDEKELIRTIIALGRLNDKESIPNLINMINPKTPEHISAIIIAVLGELKAHQAVDKFIQCLRDGSIAEEVIMKSLLKIGHAATDLLINALEDDDLYIKTCAAKLLGDIGDRKAVSALVATLHDDDIFVVDEVITSLGKIGDESAITKLLEIYRTDNQYIKDQVKSAISNIGNSKAFSMLLTDIDIEKDKIDDIMSLFLEMGTNKIQLLTDSLKDKDKYVRISALNTLKCLKPEEIEEVFAEVIQDEDSNVRQTIVKAIGELKLKSSENILIKALQKEKNQDVIIEMVWSLGEIEAVNSIDSLISIIENETYDTILRLRTADSIIKFGDISVERVSKMAFHTDEFIREASAYMLGKIGNVESLNIIRNLLNDESPSVVSMAVNALGNLSDIESFDIILKNYFEKKIKEDALSNYIKKLGDEIISHIPKIIKSNPASAPIVIRQLGYIDSPAIADLLVYIEKEFSSDAYILKSTLLAMSINGGQRELDIIMQHIYDANVETSSTAIMSMDKIQRRLG